MSPNKYLMLLSLAILLAACGKSSSSVETVDSLVTNPERLKELRQQCKTDRTKLGDVLCSRVAEATRKRFYGDGKTPYTPSETPPKF